MRMHTCLFHSIFLGMFLEKYCFCFYKQTGDERLSTNFFRISRRSAWSDSTSSSITRRPNQFPQFPYSWLDFSCTRYGYEIEHACELSCACTTCHVIIREGYASLEEASDAEEDLLDRAWGLSTTSRLACQAKLAAIDLVVEIPRYTINHAKESH